jgi:hypothetical protein
LKTYKEKEMVDFRRMIPVLAVIAFLLGSAVTASAQNAPFQCFANGGVSTPARSEGITELVGDMVLNCVGGVPTPPGQPIPQVNVQIFLNTSLTSRLLTSSTTGPQYSEALLILDEPLPGAQFACNPGGGSTVCSGYGNGLGTGNIPSLVGYYGGGTIGSSVTGCTTSAFFPNCAGNNRNVFQGLQTASNSVTFLAVPIDPPGTSGSRVVRITNVRGNANALGVAGANATPTPIVETISPTPPQFFPVSNPSQTVAFIQRGMTFGLFSSASATGAFTSQTFQQCDNSRATSTGANFNIAGTTLRYSENFATAFKKRFFGDCDTSSGSGVTSLCATNISSALANGGLQNDLRVGTYNTESGFVNPALSLPSGNNGNNGSTPPGTAGLADWGTRLKATFNNIPNGVSIFVDTNSIQLPNSVPDRAVLTASETGVFSPVGATASSPGLTTGTNPGTVAGTAQLTVTNGSATAVWEVLQSDANTFASLNFRVFATYTASPGTNSPALATATVNGSYAPTSTVTTAAAANVPRFADTSTASNIFTVVPCLTTLLFPYITTQAGFDTGIAISATATDPFGTTPQSGTCTLNWYGAAFTGATPTPIVNSGTTYVSLVSSTLNNVVGGFTGYMIAVCRFQYAHGFAFISDLGARNLAMGYLALVIPDPTSSTAGRGAFPDPCGGASTIPGCAATGENLGN